MSRTFVASAETVAPPAAAAQAIMDIANLPRWFRGARVLEFDEDWPSRGSRMEWTVGGGRWGRFAARVVEDRRPDEVVLEVETPSGRSTVVHRFEASPDGGTRYTKSVEPATKGGLWRLLMPLLLPRTVRNEVERAAELADEIFSETGHPTAR